MEDYEKRYQEGHKRNLAFLVTWMIGCSLGAGVTYSVNKIIPRTEQVQQGYIAPSKLEIECKDFNGDGKPETIMKIGEKQYSLRYDKDGEPIISPVF